MSTQSNAQTVKYTVEEINQIQSLLDDSKERLDGMQSRLTGVVDSVAESERQTVVDGEALQQISTTSGLPLNTPPGDRIRYFRDHRKVDTGEGYKLLTRDQLADMIGLSDGYVKNIENGHKHPRLEYFYKIADVFNIPVAWLFPETPGVDIDAECTGKVVLPEKPPTVVDTADLPTLNDEDEDEDDLPELSPSPAVETVTEEADEATDPAEEPEEVEEAPAEVTEEVADVATEDEDPVEETETSDTTEEPAAADATPPVKDDPNAVMEMMDDEAVEAEEAEDETPEVPYPKWLAEVKRLSNDANLDISDFDEEYFEEVHALRLSPEEVQEELIKFVQNQAAETEAATETTEEDTNDDDSEETDNLVEVDDGGDAWLDEIING